jgi:hypothetical protein
MKEPRRLPTVPAIAWLLAAWLAGAPVGAAAQGALAMACREAGGVELTCTEAAVAARAVQGHVALLGGLGAEVPGSAGTLGRRLGTTPRVSLSARASLASVGVPDPADVGSGPAREAEFILPALHGSVSVGLFDGFSPAPTVGGVLAVDLVGSAGMVFLPSGQGFDGSTPVLTVGARLGLLRESFTLPGAAVSLTRRFGASARLGELNAGDRWTATVEPTVTSVRATVGKDLLGVGLLAGVGWDHHGGEATLELPTGPAAGTDDFETTRTLIFGGASVTFLVLQISGELGWAEGFAEVPSYRNVPFDLAGGTVCASLALRLTL